MLPSLRQLLYPKEFRIAAPKWPDISEVMEEMDSSLKASVHESGISASQEGESLNIIIDIGTIMWRLQRRLPADPKAAEANKRISRDLESAWDILRQGGIEIKDHTGDKYDGGMALRVIAFQTTAGLSCEQIIETVKPTIYYKARIIRMGDVIVGTPEDENKL